MCVVSMVHDHFDPMFPKEWKPKIDADPALPTGSVWAGFVDNWELRSEIAELRKLIGDFREAVEAARKVDALTKQPDCVDPEKAKLEQRVAELERRLDAMTNAGRAQATP